MSIRPIDLNGMLQRTDDIGAIKHQEDAKPVVDQQNIQSQFVQKQDMLLHQVQNTTPQDKMNNDADAKDEGNGVYYYSSVKKKQDKKKQDEKKQPFGKVTKGKHVDGIDIKI